MHIGLICHGNGSGSTRATLDLTIAFYQCGIPVVLFTLGQARWPIPLGIRHVCISQDGAPRDLEEEYDEAEIHRLSVCLRDACVSNGIDILNYHYGFPFAQACRKLQEMMGPDAPAIVATLHGSDIMKAARDAAARGKLQAALAAADAVCTVSRAYAFKVDDIVGRRGVCRVVPNFVPAERLVPRFRVSGMNPVPSLLHISNFKQVKNVHQTGQAFLALRQHRPCRLVLAGDGPKRNSLQTLLRPCARSVQFRGRMENPAAALAEADVLLITSQAESFSLAALEAMSAGIPVVAPRLAGLDETVIDGEGGLLFTPGRPRDAARKVLRLINSPELYRRISRSARAASRRFGEARTVEGYLNIFAGLSTP